MSAQILSQPGIHRSGPAGFSGFIDAQESVLHVAHHCQRSGSISQFGERLCASGSVSRPV